jgi:hypothetical protein
MRRDDESLRFLLAGRRLSDADHDAILARVLPPARWRSPLRWLAASGLALSVGAVAVLLVLARPKDGDRVQPGLAGKGAPGAPGLAARCPDSAPGTCRRGDALLFEVDGAVGGGMLAAYAVSGSGQRIWYFPTATGHLATIPAGDGRFLVREVARLGAEHAPGTYEVHLSLLDTATDRAALLEGRAPVRAHAIVRVQILP